MTIELADVIRQVESGGNIYAMRFEAGLFSNYVNRVDSDTVLRRIVLNIRSINHCSTNTACMIAATSWGAYQILGVNLYDTSLCDVHDMIGACLYHDGVLSVAFDQFVRKRIGNGMYAAMPWSEMTDENKRTFATKYNGPGNVENYTARMDACAAYLAKSSNTAKG